tara:strand:+ start:4913 stop:6034 length:1122 start_codon:yes stop_codon:yes gene_type:complete
MVKVNAKTYSQVLKRSYKTKDPVFIYGAPGIGKSEIPKQVFAAIAKAKGLEFVVWDHASKEQKAEMFENKAKYFVLCDQRLSQMDTTDLRGIPKMNSDRIDPMPPSWVLYFCDSDADGVIFFDELNLATPVVQGSAYQIIHDRSMADMKLTKKALLIAAGNRAEDKAFTFELAEPLRDRFNEIELYPDVESWTTWAAKAQVNPHLIAFINWKEAYLYRRSDNGADKMTTPRGIARASRMIGPLSITAADANLYVSMAVGEAFATEFQAYVKYFEELNWETIFAQPDTVSGMEVNKLFAVSGGLSEHFMKEYKNFDKVLTVIEHLPEEFGVMTLRLMKDAQPASFKRRAESSKIFKTTVGPKLGKFIIADPQGV